MKSLEGTKTADNLFKAFVGESQARNRYDFYAEQADTEGYNHIKYIFEETARNEMQHAKRFYDFLIEGFKEQLPKQMKVNTSYPIVQGTTEINLKESFKGETKEAEEIYPEFAQTAREEGFDKIADAFTHIAEAEKTHMAKFKRIHEIIKTNKFFENDTEIEWHCTNCGYIHKGKKAPDKCPSCDHSKDFYKRGDLEEIN